MDKTARYISLAWCLALLAACGSNKPASPPPTFVVEIRPYFSVKTLRAASDSVLLGTFGKMTNTQRNNGGNPADRVGIPVAFFEFRVSRVLSGRDLGETVEIMVVDGSGAGGAALQPQPGEEVVIFASELSATTAPGVRLSGPTIVAISGNNGVFDVANGRAKARLNVVSIAGPDVPSSLPEAGLSRLLDLELAELELAATSNPDIRIAEEKTPQST
jgi:hypothetical protein